MKTDSTTKPKKKMNLVKECLVVGAIGVTLIGLSTGSRGIRTAYDYFFNPPVRKIDEKSYKPILGLEEIFKNFGNYDGELVSLSGVEISHSNFNKRKISKIYSILEVEDGNINFKNNLWVNLINMPKGNLDLKCYFYSDKSSKTYEELYEILSNKAYNRIVSIQGVIKRLEGFSTNELYGHSMVLEDKSGNKRKFVLSDMGL